MKSVNCFVNKNLEISKIDNRIYGSFIEHMGRAVYSGIYEPDHKTSDEQGFRQDVLAAVKDLNVPIVRYPGGNFVSGYDWRDGIGPKNERPVRLDYAWFSVENNQFGIDEFADWTKKANTEGMIAVNLGTGTPQDAGYLAEYCNIDKGTYWSDKRREYGHDKPHNFKLWCLGNEMDGPWQTCQLDATTYGRKANETAKILKWVDPKIEVVAVGSSSKEMPTFPFWDETVLRECYENVDYLSLHRYYEYQGCISDFLASFHDLDEFINIVKSVTDVIKAEKRSSKLMKLSLDEWNVWNIKDINTKRWAEAPELCEDKYTFLDTLVLGGLLCTIVNNADRIKIACLAQLVNALSPIHTKKGGDVLLHGTYYPFKQVSNNGRGTVYRTITKCENIRTKKYGDVPQITTLTTFDESKNQLAFFLLNIDENEDLELNLNIVEFGDLRMVKHEVITGVDDLFVSNTFENPNTIIPKNIDVCNLVGTDFKINVPKLSWHMMLFDIISNS